MRIQSLSALALVSLSGALLGQSDLHTVRIATGLAKPLWVGQAPGDDSRLYVLEQTQADVEVVIGGVKNPLPFLDLTGKVGTTGNERGLLGIAFHPDFANNKFFYVDYTRAGDFATVVERYTAIDGDTADPNSGLVIFGPISDPQSNHNGGNLQFGPDGKLYLGLGDGGNFNDTGTGHVMGIGNAQSPGETWGKMHRINDDGSIPSDNPFFGDGAYVQSIWDMGVRNPWRWSFDRLTGDLWIADVGQDAIEEVNFEAAGTGGLNYGWRCMEGFSCTGLSGCVCNDAALHKPIHDYNHGGGKCSITGGFVYRGSGLSGWDGVYFFADYCTAQIWSLVYNGVTATVTERTAQLAPGFGATINSITSFGQDNHGELYICDQGSGGTNGELFAIVGDGPFTDLGSALPGVNGLPKLAGVGSLEAGSVGALNFTNGPGTSTGALFLALSEGAAPFKGGVVVAIPIVALVTVATTAGGTLQIAWPSWPAGVPSATTIVFQGAFNDNGAVQGVSLTNGLRAITP